MYRTIYILICVLLLCVSVSADTLTVSTGQSADDAWYDYSGVFSTTTTNPYMGFLGTVQMIMMWRFDNVNIPQGSTVDTALLSSYSAVTNTHDPDQDFWCEDTSDATTFSTKADYDGRAKTTAMVTINAWDDQNESTWEVFGDPDVNLASIVDEVVNRSDWVSGNAIVIMTENQNASANYNRWYHYDYSSGSFAPYLYLVWTPPADGVPNARHSADGNGVRHSPDGASVRHGG